ncbi:MAG: TIGR03619 family F420-dependent LLM class oxidoreductase [Actinomycetota bacterium]|nr:TIGR03619 family F420-dependent LLM class oxidoreductase [Actinomycetota bacterium]
MKFRVALPGMHHIPPANPKVAEAETWAWELKANDFQQIARVIDDLKFHTITVSEHLAMPYFEVPRLGAFWMDALSVMSFVVGATQRVRVDTSVLVVPYHHPLALAKALSTIDVLSGGRLDVSIGVGHAEQEFEALGIAFAERGAITDETLDAVLELWHSDEPRHMGRFFRIDGLAFEPKPVQQPRPPILVGGNSKPALRRAARFEGWQPNPTDFSPRDIRPLLDYIREQESFAGKADTFEVCWVGTVPDLQRPTFHDLSPASQSAYRDHVLDHLDHLSQLGVTATNTPLAVTRSAGEFVDYLHWFSEEVIDRLGP